MADQMNEGSLDVVNLVLLSIGLKSLILRLKESTTLNATGEANWINTWARCASNSLLSMVK